MTKATRLWAATAPRVLALLSLTVFSAAAQQITLQIDPAKTSVKFTLGDALHTVHGTFQVEHGAFQFDPTSGKVSGEVVVNARSGESGSGMRDRKMHKEVLESERYPEISFRPDMVEGAVAVQGKSSVKVHGIFRIHGVDREIDVPVDVEIAAARWTATIHFTVPYAKWGMKNPSNLFLRVDDSVQIDLEATGNTVPHNGTAHDSGQ